MNHPDYPHTLEPFNSTQVPDALFDWIMADLSGAELKVLLYIIRRTKGFHKDADAISVQQMVEGIWRKDGTQLDRGTGLSKPAVRGAIKSLEERDLIEVHRPERAGRSLVPSYKILWGGRKGATNLPHPKIEPEERGKSVAGKGQVFYQKGKVSASERGNGVTPQGTEQVRENKPTGTTTTALNAPEDLDTLWQDASVRLAATMTRANWQTYFDGARLIALERTETPCAATVAVPTEFQRSWLEQKFVGLVEKVLRELLGRAVLVRFVVQVLVPASG